MAGFKLPDFKERADLSRDAKQKALEKLRAKPPVDEAVLAERLAAQERKDAAAAEKRRLKAEQLEQEKAERAARVAEAKAAAEAEAAAAALAAMPKERPKPVVDEALKKALRDAKYAARKARR